MTNDHNHDETNMESNDNTIPETNDDVFFDTNNNDESSEVCHDFQERTDYEEIIAKLKDQNASLQSQLLQASTKKYGPISTCISLDDIPDESKLRVQSLSQSFKEALFRVTAIPVIPPKLEKTIIDKCNWNNFVTKIWTRQRDYMKDVWKVVYEEWNYPDCPSTFTEEYFIETVGMTREPFARHLVLTVQLLSQDAVLVLYGKHGLELEHLLSKNPTLHKAWADKQREPCKAIMSLFHFSNAHLAPSRANILKGSMFIANFERVLKEDGSTERWINTAHNSDGLHCAFVSFRDEVISWYTQLDQESLYLDSAVICLRRKKDFEFVVGFQNLPNFNRLTGRIEVIQDEPEVALALTTMNETIQTSLRALNERCADLVIIGKTWNVGTDTTDSNNLLSNIGFVENELRECTHFGQIAISGEVINDRRGGRPGDFIAGDRSGDGHTRLKGLISGKKDLYIYLNSLIVDASSTKGGPVNNAAIIYRKRLHLFILNAFYGSTNNEQRWRMLNRNPSGGYLDMSIVDSFQTIHDKTRKIK